MPDMDTDTQLISEQYANNDTPNQGPLHLQMSPDERAAFAARHRGTFKHLSKRHTKHGNKVSQAYVSDIFHGRAPLNTPLSKRISASIDKAILKAQEKASA